MTSTNFTSAAPASDGHASRRVCFIFAANGIGGAESSMLRLMRYAHPQQLECSVILTGQPDSKLAQAVAQLPVCCYSVKPLDWSGLSALLRQIQPDVAYLFGQIRTLGWAWAARRAGVPLLVGAERGSGTRWINRLGRRLDKHVLDGYITNSRQTARVMQQQIGIRPDRIFVAYNGLDLAPPSLATPPLATPPLAALPQAVDEPIVCVANIRPLKGQIVLLQAVRRLQATYPALRAVLVGEDLTQGRFFQEVEAQGLHDTFRWTGFVADVKPYLAQASIFVLPSLYREGLPTSILEAMWAGLPVVASQVGGVDELVRDGETGWLVPPGEVEILAERLAQLLADAALRRQMGQRAREHVQHHHTMQAMVDGHLHAFQNLGPARARKQTS